MQSVAVVGATGAVGREIVRLLLARSFPCSKLELFASPKSRGAEIQGLKVEALSQGALEKSDLVFFAAGSAVSKEWIPKLQARCIDSSSAFRMDPGVPLVIPEINGESIQGARVIASPNCTATILLMPLAPLHRAFEAKRIVVSSYQAASGGGVALMQRLLSETRAELDKEPILAPYPYAFNVFPHASALQSDGYVEEEIKMEQETRKILSAPSIRLSATCVRVPVLRAHSVSANVEFNRPFSMAEIYKLLESAQGISIFEQRDQNRFATPWDATGKESVLCGRFRYDRSQPNTLEFWSVGDQLLKGAALNAVQIAEACLAAPLRLPQLH